MRISQKVANYTAGEADGFRKAMGKKKPEVLAKEFDKFSAGMKSNGYSDEAIKALWDTVLPFAGYAFNKSHAAGYGLVDQSVTRRVIAEFARRQCHAVAVCVAEVQRPFANGDHHRLLRIDGLLVAAARLESHVGIEGFGRDIAHRAFDPGRGLAGDDACHRAGIGGALAAFAGLCWALYIVFGKRLSHLHAGQSVALGMSVAALVVVPFGVAHAGAALLNPAIILAGVAVAIFSSAMASLKRRSFSSPSSCSTS